MEYRWEVDLYIPLKKYLKNKSFRFLEEEVGFFERRIDVYGFSKIRNETIAVEAKLRNWKKALQQALLYQLCSDFSYVAMPVEVFSLIDLSVFERNGVGFIGVYPSGRCRELIKAKPSSVLKSYYRDELIPLSREKGR